MKIRKIRPVFIGLLCLSILVLLGLSCNFATRALHLSTATPRPSFTPTASLTPIASSTPENTQTPTPTPLDMGLHIPAECKSQPIATLPPREIYLSPTPQVLTDRPLTSEMQLEVMDQLTKTIAHNYLYPDFNGVDWPKLVNETRARIKAGMTTSAFYDELYSLVQALGDEHSQYQSPSDVALLDAEYSGHNDFVGIGVMIEISVEKKFITLLSIFPDSPAEYAGLKAHDVILSVDGLPVVENGESYNWRVRGPQCSAAVLMVQSPGESPRQVMLVRNRITTNLLVESRLVKTQDGSRIGYIFLPSFFDETIPGQVLAALEKFGNLDGLIIDNRQNEGGSSQVVEPIMSFFTKGRVGGFVTRKETIPMNITADPIHNSQEVPLVVLVGEGTVSYGEIFAGILQDIGRAKVIGQTTLGNVEVLLAHSFKDGSRAWIAEERFDPPVSHANWEKDGIQPDIQAYADWETFTFDTDPAIVAALKNFGHH